MTAGQFENKRLPSEVEIALFRTMQEGLTNVMKHSSASKVTVTLSVSAGTIEVVLRDDGIGFDVGRVLESSDRPALGLFGMQERVNLLGGDLEIDSQAEAGTEVTISLPADPVREPWDAID